jgi:hypothetical protein
MSDIPQKPDDRAQLLRESLKRQRPNTRRVFLLSLVLVAAGAGAVLLWYATRRYPPELIVVGFDHISLPGKSVTLRAATESLEGGQERWGGQYLFFEEIMPPGAKPADVDRVRTNKDGIAERTYVPKTQDSVSAIEVRYLDDHRRPQYFAAARTRIFTWPGDSRVLVIDVEPTLKNAGDWPGLARALADAHAAGWRIAYLSLQADTPLTYGKEREWLLRQVTADQQALVDGPVLSREALLENQPEAAARKAVLAALKAQFTGPVLYLAGSQELTIQAVNSNGELTAAQQRVPGWSNLVGALPKS